jgi:hypothetical protein
MIKIKKKYQALIPESKVLNMRATSPIHTYSCDMINHITKDVIPMGTLFEYDGDTVPEGYEEVKSRPLFNYSTEEQVIGTWVDGKPIYQRTYYVQGTFTTQLDVVTDADYIDTIININGFAYTNNNAWIPVPCNNSVSVNRQIEVFQVVGAICIGIGSERTLSKVYLTIQYTKNTD